MNDIHILAEEQSNREIPGFFKISQDTSPTKIESGSQELNPNEDSLIYAPPYL